MKSCTAEHVNGKCYGIPVILNKHMFVFNAPCFLHQVGWPKLFAGVMYFGFCFSLR